MTWQPNWLDSPPRPARPRDDSPVAQDYPWSTPGQDDNGQAIAGRPATSPPLAAADSPTDRATPTPASVQSADSPDSEILSPLLGLASDWQTKISVDKYGRQIIKFRKKYIEHHEEIYGYENMADCWEHLSSIPLYKRQAVEHPPL